MIRCNKQKISIIFRSARKIKFELLSKNDIVWNVFSFGAKQFLKKHYNTIDWTEPKTAITQTKFHHWTHKETLEVLVLKDIVMSQSLSMLLSEHLRLEWGSKFDDGWFRYLTILEHTEGIASFNLEIKQEWFVAPLLFIKKPKICTARLYGGRKCILQTLISRSLASQDLNGNKYHCRSGRMFWSVVKIGCSHKICGEYVIDLWFKI